MKPIIIEANKNTTSQVSLFSKKQTGAYCRVSSEKEMQLNSFDALEADHSLITNKKDKLKLLKKTLQQECGSIECTDEIIKGLVKSIVVHSRKNIEIYLSGDIEANLSVTTKDISECTVQPVLLNTYVYDFSLMLPTSKIAKNLYSNIKFTVYVNI